MYIYFLYTTLRIEDYKSFDFQVYTSEKYIYTHMYIYIRIVCTYICTYVAPGQHRQSEIYAWVDKALAHLPVLVSEPRLKNGLGGHSTYVVCTKTKIRLDCKRRKYDSDRSVFSVKRTPSFGTGPQALT